MNVPFYSSDLFYFAVFIIGVIIILALNIKKRSKVKNKIIEMSKTNFKPLHIILGNFPAKFANYELYIDVIDNDFCVLLRDPSKLEIEADGFKTEHWDAIIWFVKKALRMDVNDIKPLDDDEKAKELRPLLVELVKSMDGKILINSDISQ